MIASEPDRSHVSWGLWHICPNTSRAIKFALSTGGEIEFRHWDQSSTLGKVSGIKQIDGPESESHIKIIVNLFLPLINLGWPDRPGNAGTTCSQTNTTLLHFHPETVPPNGIELPFRERPLAVISTSNICGRFLMIL